MSRLLLITLPLSGRLNVACAMGKILTSAGHDVFVSSRPEVADRVVREGFDFMPLPALAPDDPPEGDRRRRKVQAIGARAFRRDLERIDPDLVICDMELHAYVMLCFGAGVPTILWTDMLSVFKRRGLPPLHRALSPSPGMRGVLSEERAWLRYRLWKWIRLRLLSVRSLGADQRYVLRTIAADTDFPLSEEAAWHEWLIPFSFRSLPLLNLNAIELEFPHDPYPTMDYVGPVLDGGRTERRPLPTADRERLDSILGARRAGAYSTLIYASFGAWHGSSELDLVDRLVEAVGARPDWTMVLGLGDRTEFDGRRRLPDNVAVFDWAPQIEILAQADLAIHHGGINTINECLTHAVPTLAYPIAGRDTVGAAQRIEFHGLGEVGDRAHDSPEQIATRIERILDDRLVAARVEEFRKLFARYLAEGTLRKAVEAHL